MSREYRIPVLVYDKKHKIKLMALSILLVSITVIFKNNSYFNLSNGVENLIIGALFMYIAAELLLYPISRKYKKSARLFIGKDHLIIEGLKTKFRLNRDDFEIKKVEKNSGKVKRIILKIFTLGQPTKLVLAQYNNMDDLYENLVALAKK